MKEQISVSTLFLVGAEQADNAAARAFVSVCVSVRVFYNDTVMSLCPLSPPTGSAGSFGPLSMSPARPDAPAPRSARRRP